MHPPTPAPSTLTLTSRSALTLIRRPNRVDGMQSLGISVRVAALNLDSPYRAEIPAARVRCSPFVYMSSEWPRGLARVATAQMPTLCMHRGKRPVAPTANLSVHLRYISWAVRHRRRGRRGHRRRDRRGDEQQAACTRPTTTRVKLSAGRYKDLRRLPTRQNEP